LLLEKLEKIGQAHHAGALRRSLYRLREGPAYIQLINELEWLEQRLREKPSYFWENKADVNRFTYYRNIREQAAILQQRIDKYEMDLSLASLDLHPYSSKLANELDHWSEDLFDLKVKLYTRLHPEADKCRLGIYGNPLHPLIGFYIDLLQHKGFSWTAHGIFFAESSRKKKQKIYTYRLLDLPLPADPLPLQAGEILYGVELDISGPAAFLYFNEESGVQRWENAPNQFDTYMIKVDRKAFATPEKIHRKEFYRSQPLRRTVKQDVFRDTLYKNDYKLASASLQALFSEHLEKRFRFKLDMELL